MTTERLGWRAWGITEDEHGPLLTGRQWTVAALGRRATYPQMPATAYCAQNHEPPDPDCLCGMYFTWHRSTVETEVFPNPFNRGAKVLGQVAPLGPVLTNRKAAGIPDEQRAGALMLAGAQLLTPACADLAPALTARYGIPFTPEPDLLRPLITYAEELAYNLLDQARALARAAGLPEPMPTVRPPSDARYESDRPSKAEERA